MKYTFYLVLLFLCPVLLFSCAGSRKATKVAAATHRNIDKENRQLNDLDKKMRAQLEKGNVDSLLLRKLQPELEANRKKNERINAMATELETFLENPEAFKRDYKRKIKSRIEVLNFYNRDLKHRMVNYGMIDQTLELARPSVYGLSVFFGSGQYQIPEAYKKQTQDAFHPLLDNILASCDKYRKERKSIYVTVRGYADEQGIAEGSALYKDLVNRFQLTKPDRGQLNLALSKLRADELGPVIRSSLLKKMQRVKEAHRATATFFQEGYGEALPNAQIKDYKAEDERRRIVVVYWYVLPQM